MSMPNEDLFKKIIDKQIPADIIYEDEDVIAFMDIKPFNKGHFLVVPKIHSYNLKDIKTEVIPKLFTKAIEIANKRRSEGLFEDFKLVVNNGPKADQQVYHLHVHIIPFY